MPLPLPPPGRHPANRTVGTDLVDVETMRAAVRRLLADDAEPPSPEELDRLGSSCADT